MDILDVNLLFTSIPLGEFIDICVNQLFENTDTVEGFAKPEFKQLLCLATKECYVIFNDLLYKQTDGVHNKELTKIWRKEIEKDNKFSFLDVEVIHD